MGELLADLETGDLHITNGLYEGICTLCGWPTVEGC